MKVAELRAELKARGLDTKGKKAELEARLQAQEASNRAASTLVRKYGKQALKKLLAVAAPAQEGADGADASTCIAAPAPAPKTTVAGLRAELASRGLDTKGKKAELEARQIGRAHV